MKSTLQELAKLIETSPAIGRVDCVPNGWHSLNELAKEWGVHIETARSRVNATMYVGKVERKAFRVLEGNRSKNLFHYSIKK